MGTIRAPGIQFSSSVQQNTSIDLGETGVPAFLGVAERGPLAPVKIINFEQFKQVYGNPIPNSYLHNAVEGFFLNGGKTCFILRVAHIFRNAQQPNAELARHASTKLYDQSTPPPGKGFPLMEVIASSPGAWGNDITLHVEIPDKPRVDTNIDEMRDPQNKRIIQMSEDDESFNVKSSRGFEVGMTVQFSETRDGQTVTHYVTLTNVRGNTLFWSGPIGHPFKVSSPTNVSPVEFTLSVRYGNTSERFTALSLSPSSPRHYIRAINRESKLIRVRDLESPAPIPQKLPAPIPSSSPLKLRGGQDGIEYISPDDFIGRDDGPHARLGLASLEGNDELDLIAAPDVHFAFYDRDKKRSKLKEIEHVYKEIVSHCERLGDRFALIDLPESTSINAAQDFRIKFDTAFAAIYYPWLTIIDRGKKKHIPPSGHLAGLFAKCDREEGVHRVPANLPLEGVVDTSIVLREDDIAELNHKGINCVRSFPVRGTRPWGGRTLSSDPNWRYINIRRTFNIVRRSIFQHTQWVVFETNDASLRARLKSDVEDFLRRLWSAGYFKGESQDDAFFVMCNDENNPLDAIAEGYLLVDIGLAPVRPTEFINLRLEHTVEDRRVGELEQG
jgi:hypothetical protein